LTSFVNFDFNSTTPGTQWTINTPVANAFVNYLNVQDSVSANATLQALNSVDSLNNIFWFFGMIGGFDDAADGDWNACATWNKCPGTAIGVDYPGSVDEVTVDSHTVTITADASAKSIVISDDNETTDAVLVDGGYDMSVYGDITIEDATSILTSTGTWRQSANGSIAAPAGDLTSRINNYQILDGITSTMSDTVLVESLVLGTGSTLTGAQVLGILIDQNDPVDMIVGSSSISVESIWYMDNSSQTIQQKAFTATLGSFLYVASSGTIQMTGDWNIQENGVSADDGSLYLVGAASADESGSATLDTNGYNLSVDGFFEVGSDVTGDGSGRVYLRTGTHAIGENFKGSDTSALRGWIYMNSAIVNASGTVNFTNTTVSQGTGTVNFNATDTDNTITSWDQTFNDVVFNSATGGWTLSDGMMVADDLTVTNTAAAGVSLAGYELTVGDNVTLTGGSLFANGSNFIVKGNWDSQAGTFEPGLSTVVLNGTDLDNTITTNAETFTNFSINDGLIGYWKFDEAASAAIDSSGHGNHAVWQDAATNGTAAPNLNFVNLYSLSMDGVDDFARIESPRYSFDKAGSYTWAGWIYLDNACSGGYCTIISQSPDGGDGYSLEIENDPNSLGLYGQGYYYAASNLSYDRWYHFALTYDNGTVVVHINGVIQAEDSSDATEFVSYSGEALIGRYSPGDNSQDFNGRIDDLRFYNRVLTEPEIVRLAYGNQPETAVGKYSLADALNVDGDLILATGTLDVNGQDINVAESWYNYGGILDEENQAVTFDGGTTGHFLQSGGQTFYDLTVNGNSGSWILGDNLEVSNNFNITDGTLTHSTSLPLTVITANTVLNGGIFTGVASSIVNDGNLTLTSGVFNAPANQLLVTGNFSSAATTFEAGNGTVIFSAPDMDGTITTNAETFYNFNLGDGLVGYWKLDETAEGGCPGGVLDACDSSGYGNHGEWNGTNIDDSTSAPRPFRFVNERSIQLNGTSDYISIGTSNLLDFQKYVTLAVWVKTSAVGTVRAAVTRMQDNLPFKGYEIGKYSNDQAYFHAGGSYAANVLTSGSAINDGAWHHIAGVYDGTTSYIYVDGVLANSATRTNNLSRGTDNFDIGINYARAIYFNGSIDDVRVYNRALSAAEILAISYLAGEIPNLRLFEIMEVNPEFDQDNRTSRLSVNIITDFLAGCAIRKQKTGH